LLTSGPCPGENCTEMLPVTVKARGTSGVPGSAGAVIWTNICDIVRSPRLKP